MPSAAPNVFPGPPGTLGYYLLSPKWLLPQARTTTRSFPPWPCSLLHASGFLWFINGLSASATIPRAPRGQGSGLPGSAVFSVSGPQQVLGKYLVRERVSGSSTPFSMAALHVPETACQLPPWPVTEGEGDPQSQPQAVTPGAVHGPFLWGELDSDSASSPQGRKWGAPNSRCPEEVRATGTMDRLGDLLDHVKYW